MTSIGVGAWAGLGGLAGAIALAAVALPAGAASPPGASGAAIFAQNCAACHQPTGKGIPGAFPALDGDVFVKGQPAVVARTILKGRGGMPSFSSDLTDQQIAAVLTYVRSSWSNHAPAIMPATVTMVRKGSAKEEKSVLPGH